jgi:hypothetical protein
MDLKKETKIKSFCDRKEAKGGRNSFVHKSLSEKFALLNEKLDE